MKKVILQIGDPILGKESKSVSDILDTDIQMLINDLLDTCKSKNDITAGLSAPQIGKNLRIIVCRRMDIEEAANKELPPDKAWEVMINPEIKRYGRKVSAYWEGCLSVGEGSEGLYAPVTRADSIELTYTDRNGESHDLSCKGFFAHIVQHEVDHLNGKLFLSYVENPDTIWKSKDLDEYYQQYGEYPSF